MAASPKKVKRTLHYRKRNYGKNNDDSAPSSSMFSSLSPNALRFAHVFLVLLVIMTTLRSGLYNSSRRGFVDIDEAHVNVPLLSHWWSKIGNTQQQEGNAHPISKLRSSSPHSSSRTHNFEEHYIRATSCKCLPSFAKLLSKGCLGGR